MAFTGRLGHLEIETPWGNAGGVVKHPEEAKQMAHTSVGWVEAGSYTLYPRPGNSPNGETVYYHNPETGETFNSLGMPNKGIMKVVYDIARMRSATHLLDKPLVVNVAPVSTTPALESHILVQSAYEAGADAVILNAACPNVITEGGSRHNILSHDSQALGRVLKILKPLTERYKPLFIRTAPFETYEQARKVYSAIAVSKAVSVVFTPNTWGGQRPLDEHGQDILEVSGGVGGKSGPAMADKSYEQLKWALSALASKGIDVVSSSGIMDGKELQRRLHLGAVAGAGTTLYYESAEIGMAEATYNLLSEYADAEAVLPPKVRETF